MRSSTSSSEFAALTPRAPAPPAAPPPADEAAYERPLPALRFGAAGVVALLVFAVALAGWELYWRSVGARPGVVNSDGFRAIHRRRINEGEGRATVFVGASRTLSNVQLPVWERLSGERPIQLALEGTSPIGALEDLAADTAFRGRLVVDATAGSFFSGFAYRARGVTFHDKETPAQRWSQWLSMTLLEPRLAFLDPSFALFRLLEKVPLPDRPPTRIPEERKLFEFDRTRNARMWARLEHDSAYRELFRRRWTRGIGAPPDPAATRRRRETLARSLDRTERAVRALTRRGVEVIFVWHPVSGPLLERDRREWPRDSTWAPLLARTGARGIHWEDHPSLQGYELPEYSHLSATEADRYTAALYRIVAHPGAQAATR